MTVTIRKRTYKLHVMLSLVNPSLKSLSMIRSFNEAKLHTR